MSYLHPTTNSLILQYRYFYYLDDSNSSMSDWIQYVPYEGAKSVSIGETEEESITTEPDKETETETADTTDEIETGQRQMCLEAVQNVAQSVEGVLTAKQYELNRSSDQPSVDVFQDVFRDWDEVVKDADLPNKNLQRFSQEECQKVLQQINQETDEQLTPETYEEYRSSDHPPSEYIISQFGDWESALESVSLD